MKKFRKIMAVLVAAMMIISSFTLTAFADDTYTITVYHSVAGEKYTAYKVFDATVDSNHSKTNIYIEVPYTEVSKEENRDITYTKRAGNDNDGYTYDNALGVGERDNPVATNHYYENVEAPVAYTMYDNSPWDAAFDSYSGGGITLVPIAGQPGNNLVRITEGVFSPSAFAKHLKDYIDDMNADELNTFNTTCGVTPKTATGTTTELTVSSLGYYFVDTSLGAFCALDTTTTTATVYEKNTVPTNDKKVFNEATGNWALKENAQIGDPVYFCVTVKDGIGTDDVIKIYEKMDAGLTLTANSVKVLEVVEHPEFTSVGNYFVLDDDEKTPVAAPTEQSEFKEDGSITYYTAVDGATVNYDPAVGDTVKDASNNDFAPTFIVTFSDTCVERLQSEEEVYIYYNAKLNDKAVMSGRQNKNGALLKYSFQTGPTREAIVYTYSLDVAKDDKATNDLLAGAEFRLFRAADFDNTIANTDVSTTKALTFFKTTSGNTYRIINTGDSAPEGYAAQTTPTMLKSVAGNFITIEGLDVDTYYLVETKAPNGYKPLDAPIKIVITEPGTHTINADDTVVTYYTGTRGSTEYEYADEDMTGPRTGDITLNGNNTKWVSGGVEVQNEAGKELPSTGGMGTTVLYIVGGMLVILAGAYLFFSRKRTA